VVSELNGTCTRRRQNSCLPCITRIVKGVACMYSKISNSIRESILALRTYSGSSKLIISTCLKTVSLYRGCKERAGILPQPGACPHPVRITSSNQGYTIEFASGYPMCALPSTNRISFGLPYSANTILSSIGMHPSSVPLINSSLQLFIP